MYNECQDANLCSWFQSEIKGPRSPTWFSGTSSAICCKFLLSLSLNSARSGRACGARLCPSKKAAAAASAKCDLRNNLLRAVEGSGACVSSNSASSCSEGITDRWDEKHGFVIWMSKHKQGALGRSRAMEHAPDLEGRKP